MKGIVPSAASHRDAYRKFLRPGALAALRDSRICSRSHFSRLPPSSPRLHLSLTPPRGSDLSDSASTGDTNSRIVDRIPVFDSYGPPRCARRKRLFAARSVLLLSVDGRATTRDSNGTCPRL
ncbi:hypothetical protein MLD38_000703 [Melastoma candidum]|uniref:Uncharacterized protein n=1 Tax=Melastoma candidum TaxID=119954 RepID=A0ACB9SEV7_9MYRT|nr:hypothetical protein MLD38_000703 [Melastoma candidum]